jgi:hypothetical protein
MATLTDTGNPTLLNIMRRLNPDGSPAVDIVEHMTTRKPVLEDIPWYAGNMATGHRVTLRTALPSPKWRRMNQGIDPGKSDTAQYDETFGNLEDMSNVDIDLANLNGDHRVFRSTEDKAFSEGFAQKVGTGIFYESSEVYGLTPRYAAATGYTASNYVLAQGTRAGVNCISVWLINWGQKQIYGGFPKNGSAGFQTKDYGEVFARDANSREFRAYRTWFKWEWGIIVENFKHGVRIQYDPDDTAGGFGPTGTGLYMAMQDALEVIEDVGPMCRFYMPRTAKRLLNSQMLANSLGALESIDLGGRRLDVFQGVPIRKEDSLVAESAI